MDDIEIVHVLKMMAMAGLKVAGPILAIVLGVGIAVSLVQTITQIQEQAVVYVLKFAAVGVFMIVAGPWMLQILTSFVTTLWARIPDVH
ncbi:MAG: fliQ [Ilumatobacteraceae bacterium]|jgi:flagellar biosynthetic protein FliQ|nr:fliQ [Ilumatobacteraceae bacterium]MCU1400077.1 fliQ [Acidimicrobiales bacterium]